VVLFPLAAVWIAFVVWWAIRKGVFEAPPPPDSVRRERSTRPPGPHERGDRAPRRAKSRSRAAR
jgi:hypothetical protein